MEYFDMASGEKAIVLEPDVDIFLFETLADHWVKELELIVDRKIDGLREKMWLVHDTDEHSFFLAYDDWTGINLEPRDSESGKAILKIGAKLGINGFQSA